MKGLTNGFVDFVRQYKTLVITGLAVALASSFVYLAYLFGWVAVSLMGIFALLYMYLRTRFPVDDDEDDTEPENRRGIVPTIIRSAIYTAIFFALCVAVIIALPYALWAGLVGYLALGGVVDSAALSEYLQSTRLAIDAGFVLGVYLVVIIIILFADIFVFDMLPVGLPWWIPATEIVVGALVYPAVGIIGPMAMCWLWLLQMLFGLMADLAEGGTEKLFEMLSVKWPYFFPQS